MSTSVMNDVKLAAGSGTSVVTELCQVCGSCDLEGVLFMGYLPPVNQMRTIGSIPQEQPAYPALVQYCSHCQLVQLGLTVDPEILFPPEYPYTSGTTKILRDNFAEMYQECSGLIELSPEDLAVDIGSNDGTLLSNFKNGGHRVHGVEPTDMGHLANERGIKSTVAFFGPESAALVRDEDGPAKVITATNVFAHIENVQAIIESILSLLDDDGVFISESHYLISLIETLQYDTVYHEHLRYYSLHSLQNLLRMHGLEVIHAKRIPTHGGSIRVYAARQGAREAQPSVEAVLAHEREVGIDAQALKQFGKRVVNSKLQLMKMLEEIKGRGERIFAIGAPSRASTLINYVGLDEQILDCVLETKGSYKIGKYMPGTLIPVLEESKLFKDQPEYALLLSWHIAEELIPKLREKGFKGKFIVPLPEPKII
jgi:hypothetical protein